MRLTSALLLAAFLLPCLFAQGPQVVTASNRKARDVIQSAIDALGGDAYLQDTDLSGNGRLYSFGSTGDLDNPGELFWAYYRFPDTERIELTKKRDVIYIYKGGKGWEITYKGVAPILSAQLKQYANTSAHSMGTILKTWAHDPATLELYQGLNSFNQNQVDTVSLTNQNGDTVTVDFAADSHLPMRIAWRRDDPDTGGHYDESVIYGNWIRIGPITTPFSSTHYEGTRKMDQRFYNAVSFAPIDSALFEPAPLNKQPKR